MELKHSTIVDALEAAVAKKPDAIACTFFDDNQEMSITYRELMKKAKAIAVAIAAYASPGERVALIYPVGIEFITAFLGCMYAGVIAVPVCPPQNPELVFTLQRIIENTTPALCLSSREILDKLKKLRIARRIQQIPLINKIASIWRGNESLSLPNWDLESLNWFGTDKIDIADGRKYKSIDIPPTSIALVQYTSGSSGYPKGVMLTHNNIVCNLEVNRIDAQISDQDVCLSWLPPFHNMGLIVGILQPLYSHIPLYLMSSLAFIEQPARWLRAMSKYQATVSGGFDLAYQQCIRKVSSEEKKKLDLSHWELAFCAGEAVRPGTLDNFYQAFRSTGVRKEIFYPIYGLTETTLFALGSKRNHGLALTAVDKEALASRRLVLATADSLTTKAVIGYYNNSNVQKVLIINPETSEECQEGEFGDIWFSSPSVAAGYWQQMEDTETTFHNYFKGDGPYLNTGDIGCKHGAQIIVMGKHEELIIIRGKYYYPQDIEFDIGSCHSNLIPGNVAAFSIDNSLIIVAEVSEITEERAKAVFSTIRRSVTDHDGIRANIILLIRAQTIKKTASGKIRRAVVKKLYLAKRLEILYQWVEHGEPDMDLGFLPTLEEGIRVIRKEVPSKVIEPALGAFAEAENETAMLASEKLTAEAMLASSDGPSEPLAEEPQIVSTIEEPVAPAEVMAETMDILSEPLAEKPIMVSRIEEPPGSAEVMSEASDIVPEHRAEEPIAAAAMEVPVSAPEVPQDTTFLLVPDKPILIAMDEEPVAVSDVIPVPEGFTSPAAPKIEQLSLAATSKEPPPAEFTLVAEEGAVLAPGEIPALTATPETGTDEFILNVRPDIPVTKDEEILPPEKERPEAAEFTFTLIPEEGLEGQKEKPSGETTIPSTPIARTVEVWEEPITPPASKPEYVPAEFIFPASFDEQPASTPPEDASLPFSEPMSADLSAQISTEPPGIPSEKPPELTPLPEEFIYPDLQEEITPAPEEPMFSQPIETASPAAVLPESPVAVSKEPIAVIGMSCRFPGAENVNDYWQLLTDQRDAITEVPIERWDNRIYYDPDPQKMGKISTRFGGFLRNIDQFDATFFSMSPVEAELLDPQHRLLLEVTWEALNAAGIDLNHLSGSKTSVFTGISSNDYSQLLRSYSATSNAAYIAAGNAASGAAGRIAYYFGLRGSSVAIDTAGSSSLVAVHEACQDLHSGHSQLAIASGVNLILTPDTSIGFSRANLLAPDGHCKSFDAKADGYVRAEGCGVVVLKRLSDAQRDNNPILAIIAGSAVNHGGASEGFTLPSELAQASLLQDALNDAKLKPHEVDYLEAHATGIAHSDSVEADAIRSVFKEDNRMPLFIGSVKTNIGHLEAAAGIAGLIKVILALQHHCIPANLHFETPNPLIDFDSIPGLVPVKNYSWPSMECKRRAGVSSFGFTGTNAHVILEESPLPQQEAFPVSPPFKRQRYWAQMAAPQATSTHVHTQAVLKNYYEILWRPEEEMSKPQPTASLPEPQRLQEKLTHAFSMLAVDLTGYPSFEKALNCLILSYISNAFLTLGWKNEVNDRVSLNQWMADANIVSPYYRLMNRLMQVLVEEGVLDAPHQGVYRVKKTLSAIDTRQQEDIITNNFPEQTSEMMLLTHCAEKLPDILQGTFDPLTLLFPGTGDRSATGEETPLLSITYNRLMAATIKSILEKWPKNTPLTLLEVGAGTGQATKTLLNEIKNYPVHYVYTDSSQSILDAAKLEFNQYDFIEYQLFDVENDPASQGIDLQHFSLVIASNVLHASANLSSSLKHIHQLLSPGGMLILLENTRQQQYFDLTFGLLTSWWRFEDRELRTTYPLLSSEEWTALLQSQGFLAPSIYTDPVTHLGQSILFAKAAPFLWTDAEEHWLVFADAQSNHLAIELSAQLKAVGKGIIRVEPGEHFTEQSPQSLQVNPECAADFTALFNTICHKKLQGVIYLWPLGTMNKVGSERLTCQLSGAVNLVDQLLLGEIVPRLYFVTQGVNQIHLEIPRGFQQAPLWGLANGITSEHPRLPLICVDLDIMYTAEEAAYMVFHQLWRGYAERQVSLRQYTRFVARLVPYDMPEFSDIVVHNNRSYLITGGLNGLGLEIASWLVQVGVRYLLLIGRSVTDQNAARIAELEKQGVRIEMALIDVAEKEALAAALQTAKDTLPPLCAVIHAETVVNKALPIHQSLENYHKILAAKVDGTWNLHQLTHHYQLDHFILCSSIESWLGSPGQSSQAAASAYLDAFAHYRQAIGLPALSIDWGQWPRLGDATTHAYLRPKGVNHFSLEQGLEALGSLWNSRHKAQLSFAALDWSILQSSLGKNRLFFRELMEVSEAAIEPAVKKGKMALSDALDRVDANERLALIEHHVREQLALVIKEPLEAIEDNQKGFVDWGLDSLMAETFRHRLQSSLGPRVTLPPTLIYEHPNICHLSDYINQQFQPGKKARLPGQETFVDEGLSSTDNDIAIVGYSCRYPGDADTPEKLWQILIDHQDVISDGPPVRWDNTVFSANSFQLSVEKGGFLAAIDQFDGEFFGISSRELTYMDPQQRLLLEVTWEALERAGIAPLSLRGTSAGVYIGISGNDYLSLIRRTEVNTDEVYIPVGNALSVAAGRISYFLGLEGPCLSVDTACSSSLTAAHLAVGALRRHECALAIAGGVNLILTPEHSIDLTKSNMLSPDGRCKSFDKAANGFSRSEGCGIFVLKRLETALEDNDHILGVIKGSVINQDGASAGLTTPSLDAQKSLLQKSLQDARLHAADIDYVEAHGSGTALGDAVEVDALCIFGEERQAPLMLGAIKSNIGHTEAAAGAASLMKVLLSFTYESIPANLHFNQINPAIDLEQIPAHIVTENTPWVKTAERKRRAGVSSFGFSGTNAHLVLEEAPETAVAEAEEADNPPYLFTLSAKTSRALDALIEKYQDFLRHTPMSLATIAHTANGGRTHFSHRMAVLANNTRDLQEKLANQAYATAVCSLQSDNRMDEQVQNLLQKMTTLPSSPDATLLEQVVACYLQGADIPWSRLFPTARKKVILPTYCFQRQSYGLPNQPIDAPRGMGHPFSGSMIISAQNQYIFTQRMDSQRMGYLNDFIVYGQTLMPAAGFIELALNAGQQIFERRALQVQAVTLHYPLVLARGTSKKIQIIAEKNHADKAFLTIYSLDAMTSQWDIHCRCTVRPLDNIQPEHLLLDAIIDRLTAVSSPQSFYEAMQKQGLSYGAHFRTLNGLWISETEVLADVLCSFDTAPYLAHPVLVESAIEALLAAKWFNAPQDTTVYLPIRIEKFMLYAPLTAHLSIHGSFQEEQSAHLITATLWIYDANGLLLAELEGLQLKPAEKISLMEGGNAQTTNAAHYYEFIGESQPRPVPVTVAEETWLLFSDEELIPETLQGLAPGDSIQLITQCLTPDGVYDKDKIVSILRHYLHANKVIYWPSTDQEPIDPDKVEKKAVNLLFFLQAVLQVTFQQPLSLILVSQGALAFENSAIKLLLSAGVGLYRTFMVEHPELGCAHIDLDPAASGFENGQMLCEELQGMMAESLLAYRQNKRFSLRLVNQTQAEEGTPLVLNSNGSYLVTGGLGEIGLQVAEWLINQGAKHLVLADYCQPTAEIRHFLKGLREHAFIETQQIDISREAECLDLISHFNNQWPLLCGIIHTAGVVEESTGPNQTGGLQPVFKPKVYGAWNLHVACLQYQVDLDFFILFSSLASVLGIPGQSNDAAANSFLDSLAVYRHQHGLPASSINWGIWPLTRSTRQVARGKEFLFLSQYDYQRALSDAIRTNKSQVIFAGINWPVYLETLPEKPGWLQNVSDLPPSSITPLTELSRVSEGVAATESEALTTAYDNLSLEQLIRKIDDE